MELNDLILSDDALKIIDEGTWIGDFDEAPGLELFVVGLQSDAAVKAQQQKQATARAKNRGKRLTEEQLSDITKEVLGEVVLKGWRGLVVNGDPVEFSAEQARKWVTSRGGKKLAGLTLIAADRVDNQAADLARELEKN